MGQIHLDDMLFYAHHGYYTDERKRGNNYHIDVYVDYDMDKAGMTDQLEHALNYEVIYNICKAEMGRPRHLIETVARNIALNIKEAFPAAEEIKVTVRKATPGLGGPVKFATVTYSI